MKKFDYQNYVNNLPDYYEKRKTYVDEQGKEVKYNNFNILEGERLSIVDLYADIEDVFNSLDIEKATGETLDMYGEMLSQPRGKASDEQYRMMIKAKIMQSVSGGDYRSVVNALCMTFNCSPKDIYLKETDKPCTVELALLPYDTINNAGFTIQQTIALVETILPVGVKLEHYSFEGTFMFSANDWEMFIGNKYLITSKYEYKEWEVGSEIISNWGFSFYEHILADGEELYSMDYSTPIPVNIYDTLHNILGTGELYWAGEVSLWVFGTKTVPLTQNQTYCIERADGKIPIGVEPTPFKPTAKGFSDDEGKIKGGYLGTLGHYYNETILPV